VKLRLITAMTSDFNPLSHDAFIVLSELESLGNQCTRELLTKAVHKRGIKGLDTLILELVKANQVIEDNYRQLIIACYNKRDKLQPPKTLSYKEANKSQANKSQANKSQANKSKAIISCAVKGMHAGYQAVVDGKKPRYSPIHEYARKLSRADLSDYWNLVGRMSDAERSRFSASITRLLD